MSGFSESNIGKMSGLIGKTPTIEVFTNAGSTVTWTKPDNITTVAIQLIGAGGGGASGGRYSGGGAGGGGGGGNAGSYQDTHGGAWNNFTQGGAGNGFDTNDTQTSSVAAAAGISRKYGCGNGGAGLHNGPYDHANEIGGDGGSPGGGGGASEKNTVGHVRGGHGGRGEVRIWAI